MSEPLSTRVTDDFAAAFGGVPAGVVRAPGRVNLIGDHTDYNDGLVLPMAIACETRVAWRATEGNEVRVVAGDMAGQADAFALAVRPERTGDWRDYVRGAVHAAAGRGLPVAGAELAIAGDIPQGSGLSSSAALEVAVVHAMAAAAGAPPPEPIEAALAAQSAENDFVGTRCGIMDQLVIAAAEPGAALLIDCRSLESRAIAVPSEIAIVIVESGVTRGLVHGEYNLRRGQCEAAAAALGLASLRDAVEADLVALEPTLRRRARHVVRENARVLEAAEALLAGDLAALGRAMEQSHESLRDDFAVSHPEVDLLVATLQSIIGAEGGARMTGGGFGGAVVAAVHSSRVDEVRAGLAREWEKRGRATPKSFIARPQGGAGPVGQSGPA